MNKKRYLLGLIIILFIASVTSALGAVTITPLNPTSSDDLTCLVNGGICDSASLCTSHWTGNSFSGEKLVNPLPHKFISAGDKVKCEAWASAPMGDYLIGSASVTIATPPVNTPPSIFGRIPDYNILRNSGLNDNLVPLWNFASDVETPTNRLIFTITRQTNTPVVNCVIDNQSNRAVNPGVFVDCTAQTNQIGYSDITVRVMDAGGLWTEDIFRVSVIGAGNIPPTLTFLPDVTIAEDSGLNMNLIDLWNYAYDAETPDDQLIFTITSETGLTITDCSIRNNRYIECLALLNQNGISDVTVTVQDQGGLVASDTFRVIVTPVNDAPVVSNILDVTMYEDLPNSADPQTDLDNYVNDPDGDIVSWTASSSTPNLAVIINPDNTITFNPVLNWFGTAVVTFTATDPGGLTGSDSISVIVYPVNDVPVIAGIPNQTFLEDFGTADNAVNLWNYAVDVETPTNQLTFSVLSQSAPGIVDCRLDSNRYIDCTSQQDQNGFSDITVQVSDFQGGIDTAVFRITVTPVNDAPTISPVIPDQIREEDSNPWSFDLTSYGHDAEDAQTALRWSVAGVNAALFSTSFDANNRIITFTPVANACGSDVITLTVTDLQGLAVSQDITVTLTCVNDLPWINPIIPDQTRDEDSLPWSLDLTTYGNDIEDAQTALRWSVSGVDTNLFSVSFNAANRVITFTPVANAFGSDVITLTVTDSGSASVSQNIRITLNPINDAPTINPVIPDQFRDEGSLPWGLDLRLYEHDVEDSGAGLTWTVSGVNTALFTVTIDTVTHIATFILANSDVSGSDTITFTLTDSQGASVSQNILVTINPVNDAPVVSDIPDTSFNEDTTTTINLDNYVSDVDNTDAQMTWTASGNTNIIININPATHIASLSAPLNWNGQEAITLQACDLGGLCDSDDLIVNVLPLNDAPVVSPFPQVILDEDTTTVLDLNQYVNDIDNLDSQISWTYSGNTNIAVTIAAGNIAVFTPSANWNGQELITFTARDPAGLTDLEIATVIVNAVNDAPVVDNIPDVRFNEDNSYTTSWSLNNFVSDIEDTDAQISWTFSGNTNVNVVINADRTVTFTPNANFNGAEVITFRASDTGGLSDDDGVTVIVDPINDAPIVGDIPNLLIPEDGVDFSIDLDNYVSDVDNTDAQIIWTYSGNTNIIINIDPATHLLILTPLPNWNGQEIITFRACDPSMLCNSDPSTITVTSQGDAPVVSDIPAITFNEDGTTTFDLNPYVSDPDNTDAQMTWTTSGNSQITINIVNGIATFTVAANWNGFETVTFTATDPTLLSDSDVSTILVNAINDIPVISGIPNPIITVNEDSASVSVDLTNYASDIENPQSALIWSVSNVDPTLFTTSFNPSNKIITFTPLPNACGVDNITLIVTDLEGATASQTTNAIINCINDPPIVSDIPNIQLVEDSSPVTLIQLDNFVSDVETPDSNIIWTYSPVPANIGININSITHEVTFSILTPNWNGQETVTFRATDAGGLFGEDNVIIIVTPVNDAPTIASFSPATPVNINEGSLQSFSVTASDVETPPASLIYIWKLDGSVIPGAITDNYNYNAPNGPSGHTLEVIVSDGSLTVSQLWNINVANVPPQGVSAGGPYYCAAGSTVMLTGTATDPVDTLTYSWDFDNDGAYDDSTGQNPSFLCATSGIFNIGLSVSDGTDSVTATTTITNYNLVINEIMQHPNKVSDAAGEWFELYNAGTFDVDLNGWRISDLGSDNYVISGSLVIPSGDYLVLCRNSDTSLNGGVNCDYQYASFTLGNADDEIILTTSLGLEIDRVEYDGGPNFPNPTGASMELINPSLNNNIGANWQTATIPYGLGDLGTPGSANGGVVITECNDGLDNDGDGEIDLADFGCVNILDNSEVGVTQCGDGIDNDVDTFIDQNDPDCTGPLDNDESTIILPACSDGVDNDGDTYIDINDAGCYSGGAYNPSDNDETNNGALQCNNGIDDDSDTFIDWPLDPQCAGPIDNDENIAVTPACSDGIDNDGDAYIDANDAGCYNTLGIYDPNDNNEVNTGATQCSDGIDNDADGNIDWPLDADCSSSIDNDESAAVVAQCNDGIDNDGDGEIDLADFGCVNILDNSEVGVTQCGDGIDNDVDTFIDQNDPDCTGPLDNDESTIILPACSDGVDNDGDTYIDINDAGCYNALGIYDPTDNNEINSGAFQCNDNIDNDADGDIDWPLDLDCSSPIDNDESIVVNNPPVINTISVTPNFPNIDNTLTCTVTTSDPDGDPVIVNYVWTTTGVQDLSAFTSNILPLSLISGEANGDIITCRATPYDGKTYGTPMSYNVMITSVAATLNGVVSDGINNNIYNSLVEIKQGGVTVASSTTSDVGAYLFNLLSGTYDIVVSKAGFVTTTITNFVVNGGANTKNINLIEDNTIAGRISGSIRDMSNNAIPDATVIIKNSLTGITIQRVKTDSSGNYIVTGLPVSAAYDLEAQKAGYTFVVGAINVGVSPGATTINQNIFMSIP